MALPHLRSSIVRVIAASIILGVLSAAGAAQTDAELRDTTVKALTLLNEGKFLEAEPELAKLVQWMPDVANLRIMYGTALVFKSKQISDNDEAKKAAELALVQFQEAKRLGSTDPDVDKIITTLGGSVPNGQQNTAKASVFEQAEIKFAQSRYDEALVLYKKALEEDPKNYDAALYSADCLMQLQDYDNAEKYYQKAIAIDPTRETAYRYSATHLMKRVGMSDNYLPELTIGGVKLSIITCTSSTTMLSQDRTLVIILAITMQVILSQSDL
jgi:tetratricopeptide (TPR) repeat protein